MLENNILKERENAQAIAIITRRILNKFVLQELDNCYEKEESKTLLEYQKDIDRSLEESLNNLKLLEEAIGD